MPGPVIDAFGAAVRRTKVYAVIGVEEREPHGGSIYNTTLYFGPDGALLGKHRKLVPTGSERTVWAMGDGSTLPVIDTPYGRLSGLICWENYMPLARFYLYAQGVDIWAAPTLAAGDGWIASMRHIAREARCYVWPAREGSDGWVDAGNSVIVSPLGEILAGPVRHEETTFTAEIDLAAIHSARHHFDPVGHYNRPDIFRLTVDTQPRPAVITASDGSEA